jgi:hypothetical protein
LRKKERKKGREGKKEEQKEGRKKRRKKQRKERRKEGRKEGRKETKEGKRFIHLNNRQNFQYHNKDQEQEHTSTGNISGNEKTGFVLYSITI